MRTCVILCGLQDARPSVAHITTLSRPPASGAFLQLEPDAVRPGSGSGFLWDERHVVTNYHVIQSAHHLKVTLSNQRTYQGDVVGSDPNNDVAVLRLASPPLDVTPITVGTSHDLMVGQRVFAIGNPFGLDQTLTGTVRLRASCVLSPLTVGPHASATLRNMTRSADNTASPTREARSCNAGHWTCMHAAMQQPPQYNGPRQPAAGIVSSVNRQIQGVGRRIIRDVIQTDAAINPGNSGGPLLDSSGRLIGVNTMIYSPSGGNVGIGFAVPINTVRRSVAQLIATGRMRRGRIGLQLLADEPSMHTRHALQLPPGVIVHAVEPNSGAAQAGIRCALPTPVACLPNLATGAGF